MSKIHCHAVHFLVLHSIAAISSVVPSCLLSKGSNQCYWITGDSRTFSAARYERGNWFTRCSKNDRTYWCHRSYWCSLPYPTSGNLYSIISQTLAPSRYYTPVSLTISTPYYISLESDGYTVTVQKQGLYSIAYFITPSTGANANSNVALLLPNGGSVPTALLLSNRPMMTNNVNVTAEFVASLPAGEQLFLGVWSSETVTLSENAKRSTSAILSIVKIQEKEKGKKLTA